MIGKPKPYSVMKESGIEWLGDIPEHWDLPRTKTILRERSCKGFADEPLLASTQTKGVVRKEDYENRTVLALKDLHLLKLVRQGDFVISLRSFQGGIEYAREQGIISPAYTILYTENTRHHRYLAHLFKSEPYIGNLGLYVTGIRQGQNIDYEKLSRSRLPLPPSLEQAAIVRYLDHVDRRVRRLVRAKRKLIALLNEQKQAIIHRAVTRGLDPDVPLKDSGVEWLGEVPDHWEVLRLKSLVTEAVAGPYGSSLTKSMYTTAGYRVYGQQQVIPDDFSVGDYYISEAKFQEMQRYRVHPGDVLVSVMGTVGRVGVVPKSAEPGIINPRLVRYRPDSKKIRSRYLQLTMMSPSASVQLSEGAKGTTMEGLNMQILGGLVLLIPPLDAQDAILTAVAHETKQLDRAVDDARQHLEFITEFRTRLIADVVTGKLDVREAAAALPEVDPLDIEDNLEDTLEAATEIETDDAELTWEIDE